MKYRTSKKKNTKGSKFQVYTPRETGDERKRTLLRRIGFFKESAVVIAITSFIGMVTYYKNSTKPEKGMDILKTAATTIIVYLITSGLYLLFFEVGNFGFPKERNFLKFKRIYTYMIVFLQICLILGINVAGIMKLDEGKLNKIAPGAMFAPLAVAI
jgi:hypothetical protein